MQDEEITYREFMKTTLLEIKSQVQKTNGRVTILEKWQSYVVGFCVCLGITLFSILIPVITAVIQNGNHL